MANKKKKNYKRRKKNNNIKQTHQNKKIIKQEKPITEKKEEIKKEKIKIQENIQKEPLEKETNKKNKIKDKIKELKVKKEKVKKEKVKKEKVKKEKKPSILKKLFKKKTNKKETTKKKSNKADMLYELFTNKKKDSKTNIQPKKGKRLVNKDEIKYNVALNSETPKEPVKKSSWLKRNFHLFFNIILIVSFIILGLFMILSKEVNIKLMIYASLILIFFMTIAISYNKYTSGKIFTIILCAIMGFISYKLEYNGDLLHSLDKRNYTSQTYYIVTINNNMNKKIYSLNNKKIALMKDNNQSIKVQINNKLSKVTYLEYQDKEKMISDFLNQQFRGIVLTPNEYQYIQNTSRTSKDFKVQYEFEIYAKK